jgi:predicted PolB exonuclease-like 3'-5' exonuclease
MANNNQGIGQIKNLGSMNGYNVQTVFESKRQFPTVKQWNGNGYDERRMPVLRLRKTVRLTDQHGDTVEFSAYVHRGQTHYKDSREKRNNGKIGDLEAFGELERMLGVSNDYARRLLSVGSATPELETA